MTILSRSHTHTPKSPLFCGVLANTLLSTVPGLSGAGPDPQGSLMVPNLDAELIIQGKITSCNITPNTGTGCPTPASITRSMAELAGFPVLFINAGLMHRPTVPCLDFYSQPGQDPRVTTAVPDAKRLYSQGQWAGSFLSKTYDTLVIGECVPGGTTTALCVLRAGGYQAHVSSAAVKSPKELKEEIVATVLQRIETSRKIDPLELITEAGDPMMAVVAGIASTYSGKLYLAGGTQMLAVASIIKELGVSVPDVVTTIYVQDDKDANCIDIATQIGTPLTIVNPDFGSIGHSGLVRYCIGEVKEGMGAGGAIFLAHLLGYQLPEIKEAILKFVTTYCPSKPL
ncbi:MAG TPA: TIGR00303 family protein [Methanospirillum sp.]|uniref:nicotinate mononucleotide-dependent phosphoribosyltransferase CobT n=1 Tax=Methanospirillum sp. TaxID=45200 RepID=UPI002C5CCBD2|nr:TIGR00303 family protein [Methanospirillum sp.]HWQ65057.1 TIGR00303 family protein [Methanospirillum sp.]